MACTKVLEHLKGELERLYEIEVPLAIGEFLTTDRSTAQALANGNDFSPSETLFVQQEGEDALVTLFIDAAVVERLRADNPIVTLHDGNLPDFCIALEGVSHFTYLAWRAGHNRPVTQLELEMQAEVDKFVTSALLLRRQSEGWIPRGLGRRLFDNVSFRPDLDSDSRERYETANRHAGRYCELLERRWLAKGRPNMRDLRRFYRLNHEQKIRHIARVN